MHTSTGVETTHTLTAQHMQRDTGACQNGPELILTGCLKRILLILYGLRVINQLTV
jgi:hypothetical protein